MIQKKDTAPAMMVQPTCKDYCAGHAKDWKVKCQWTDCGDCSECSGEAPSDETQPAEVALCGAVDNCHACGRQTYLLTDDRVNDEFECSMGGQGQWDASNSQCRKHCMWISCGPSVG